MQLRLFVAMTWQRAITGPDADKLRDLKVASLLPSCKKNGQLNVAWCRAMKITGNKKPGCIYKPR